MSTVTTAESEAGHEQSRPCRPWGIWGTALWAAAAGAGWMAAQFLIVIAVLVYLEIDPAVAEMSTLVSNATILSAVALGSTPIVVGIFALAVRLARCPFADYLALVRPDRRTFILGLILTAVFLPALDLATWLSGRDLIPDFMIGAYTSARDRGTLVLLILAIVVAAPVGEEIAFRGFIYRGWSESRIGPAATIAITSAAWALLHTQYEWFFVAQIFLAGLLLGWLRWRSGSTLLTIGLHALINALALLQTAAKVHGWI
jgi:uncharacterized protein